LEERFRRRDADGGDRDGRAPEKLAKDRSFEWPAMKWLDLTLPGASGNLACDEALLEACEDSPDAEMLRFWEPRHYFVVLGYANRAELEVNLAACRK